MKLPPNIHLFEVTADLREVIAREKDCGFYGKFEDFETHFRLIH
jgi:hypothetical protein